MQVTPSGAQTPTHLNGCGRGLADAHVVGAVKGDQRCLPLHCCRVRCLFRMWEYEMVMAAVGVRLPVWDMELTRLKGHMRWSEVNWGVAIVWLIRKESEAGAGEHADSVSTL